MVLLCLLRCLLTHRTAVRRRCPPASYRRRPKHIYAALRGVHEGQFNKLHVDGAENRAASFERVIRAVEETTGRAGRTWEDGVLH